MASITLFHGSQLVIPQPSLSKARPRNDYGCGFYTTRDHALACEWACQHSRDGYVNRYELWLDGLAVLDLLDGTHNTLEWVALLLKNRRFDLRLPTASLAREALVSRFCPDLSSVDVVVGYRADDSYFSYARAFVENALPLSALEEALRLGKLGEQTVLVSGRSFSQLTFTGSEPASGQDYHPRFLAREAKAREDFQTLMSRQSQHLDDLFILDILREEMTPHDPRLRAHVSCRL